MIRPVPLLPLLLLPLLLPSPASGADRIATVRGEVARPGAYVLAPGETLSSLLARAGGYADNAFLPGAILSRKSVHAAQAEELAALVGRIASAAASNPGEPERTERFLAALRRLSPSGRLPIRLSHLRLLKGSPDDVPMEDGDDLLLPTPPSEVTVAGAVASPGRYPIPAGADAQECLRAVGGLTERADRKAILLAGADGRVTPLPRGWILWNEAKGRWELAPFRSDTPRAGPGDALIVPEKPDRLPWVRAVGDFPAILGRIVAITGTVVLP